MTVVAGSDLTVSDNSGQQTLGITAWRLCGELSLGHLRLAPFDLASWQSHLEDFVRACAGSSAAEEAERIRQVFWLLRRAPDVLRNLLLPDQPEEQELEALLRVGANESAAISLLGRDCAFMASRGSSGVNLATVVLPGAAEDLTAEGATLALALLTALASALLSIVDDASHGRGEVRRPASGRDQSL